MKALLEQRAGVVARMKELRDLANKQDRPWTAEDEQAWSAADADLTRLDGLIEKEKRMAVINSAIDEDRDTSRRPGQDGQPGGQQRMAGDWWKGEMERRFGPYADLPPSVRALADSSTPENHHEFRRWLRGESRAYTVQTPSEGGYTVTPMQFQAGIIANVIEISPIVGQCTHIPVTAGNLGTVVETAEPSDAEWTSELSAGTEETTARLGRRDMAPIPLTKMIKVSKQLRRMSPNFEAYVIERLSMKMAAAMERAILQGSGANEPLGVFTASAAGVTTARDVALGSTTDITNADKLVDLFYTLKATHARNATWVMHRDAARKVRKLKTGAGDYIWQPGLAAAGDTILGRPLVISEFAPNTFTSALYTVLVGNFTYYTVGDWLSMQLQIADQLYAATNQDGFFMRAEHNGQPTLAEAFARGQQST